jgi:protein arginine kinase activator
MQCQVCKKSPATVHLTQIIENQVKKVDLCEACAKEKGVNDPTGFSLADLLLGLGASQKMEEAKLTKLEAALKAAIAKEDFETAATLRDEIKQAKKAAQAA